MYNENEQLHTGNAVLLEKMDMSMEKIPRVFTYFNWEGILVKAER